MAIAVNNTSSGNSEGTGSPGTLTFEHVVNAGDNRILTVGVTFETSGGGLPTVDTITYDSVGLTKINSVIYKAGYNAVELWYLLAPNVGTANVVITLTGALAASSGLLGGAITINGATQQAPEANDTASGTSTTASVSITTQTNNAWVIDAVATDSSSNDMTVGAGQTERYEQSNDCRGNGSTEPVESAGEIAMSWTLSSDTWGICAASFEEVSAGEDVIVEPSAIALTAGVNAPTINYDYVVAIGSALALTGTLKAPTVSIDYIIAVESLALTLALQDPEVGMFDGDYEEEQRPDTDFTELTKPTTSHTELEKPTTTHTELSSNLTEYTSIKWFGGYGSASYGYSPYGGAYGEYTEESKPSSDYTELTKPTTVYTEE